MATTFWCAAGRPMSAAQFVESLFGALPSLFNDEDELRKIWSRPDTRKTRLESLSEKGFGAAQLGEINSLIDENSDIFDVLAYAAFTQSPKTRQERAEAGKARIAGEYDDKPRAFLDFVLADQVTRGDYELAQEKLSELIGLKYGTAAEAAKKLGGAATIRDAFIGFQHHFYEV
jgi:type I restriction enzyme R subunit